MVWRLLAVVENTFTHEQYTEQPNETQYLERIYITSRIHKHNNKNTYYTKLNRNIPIIQPYTQWYKIEPKEYERSSETSYGLYNFKWW